ncbi:hypothetical protein [Streptomyces sp. NPDC048106]
MSVPDEIWFTRCPVPTATGIAADRGTLAEATHPALVSDDIGGCSPTFPG